MRMSYTHYQGEKYDAELCNKMKQVNEKGIAVENAINYGILANLTIALQKIRTKKRVEMSGHKITKEEYHQLFDKDFIR